MENVTLRHTPTISHTHTHTHTRKKSYPKAIKRPTTTCLLEEEIKKTQKEDYRKHKGHQTKWRESKMKEKGRMSRKMMGQTKEDELWDGGKDNGER